MDIILSPNRIFIACGYVSGGQISPSSVGLKSPTGGGGIQLMLGEENDQSTSLLLSFTNRFSQDLE